MEVSTMFYINVDTAFLLSGADMFIRSEVTLQNQYGKLFSSVSGNRVYDTFVKKNKENQFSFSSLEQLVVGATNISL